MRKNVAGQFVSFQMNATADGAAVLSGTPAVVYTIDGGSQAVGAGAKVHKGNGQWSYTPDQAETNGDHVAFTMVIAGAITQTVNTWPVAFNPSDATAMGMTVLNTVAADVDGLNGAAMRGTDNAATASDLSTHDTKLTTVDTVVDGIQADLSNATDGLGAIKTSVDAIPTTPMRGTDGANTVVPDNAGIASNNAELTHASYGLAQLVRSATPGNALAINAAGLVDILVATTLTGLPAAKGSDYFYFLKQMMTNRLKYDKALDNMILYEDNSSTVKLTFAMVDDAAEATRGKGT